jgi:hypothetical protein
MKAIDVAKVRHRQSILQDTQCKDKRLDGKWNFALLQTNHGS